MNKNKTFATIAIGASSLLLLTGCMSVDIGVNVNEDGTTADIAYSMNFEKDAFKGMLSMESDYEESPDGICADIQEMMNLEDDDAVWTETDDKCIATVSAKATYSEKGITQMETPDGQSSDEELGEAFQITKNENATTVALDFTEVFTDEFDMMVDDFTASVTFPAEITTANFEGKLSEDKKTVVWSMEEIKTATDAGEWLEVTGQLSSGANFTLWIILGVGAIIIIGGAIFFLTRKKTQTEVVSD